MVEIKKKPQETEEQFLWRVGQLIDSKQIQNWSSINDIVNTELGIEETEWRGESAFRKRYQAAKNFYDNCFSKMEAEQYQKEINEKIKALEKAKIKVQTEKLELSKWMRQDARDELIYEKIRETIHELEPLNSPEYIPPIHNTKAYALAFGDEHYGVEFEIRGLFNEIINAYSPEIFEERMWDLYNQVLEFVYKEKIDTLHIFSLGDFTDGILRVSQLMKLRYGVVDGTIKYAHFVSTWLNELTKHVRVKYHMTSGNHSELRILNGKKGTFEDENMSKVVAEFIKLRLENNPNFTFIENPTGYIYAQLACYTVLGIHGEVKDMEKAIKDFSKIYSVPIDYLIGGHFHHHKSEEVGYNSEIINAGSIIGVDKYSLSLNKAANASAKLLVFEQTKGLVSEHRLKLN